MPKIPRSAMTKARITPVTKAEIEALMAREDRTESDIVRILIEEALVERAKRTRR